HSEGAVPVKLTSVNSAEPVLRTTSSSLRSRPAVTLALNRSSAVVNSMPYVPVMTASTSVSADVLPLAACTATLYVSAAARSAGVRFSVIVLDALGSMSTLVTLSPLTLNEASQPAGKSAVSAYVCLVAVRLFNVRLYVNVESACPCMLARSAVSSDLYEPFSDTFTTSGNEPKLPAFSLKL